MDNKFNRELWVKAQEIAREKYNEEFGGDNWEEADKYEREDWVWAEYEALKATYERNNNNETTNKNLNKRGNDIMMNKNTEKRMEKLAQAGIATENFFNLSMNIPFGAEVKIIVDGKEMVVPATNEIAKSVPVTFNSPVIIDGATLLNDTIAQSIINDGYVKNSKLFRRFITAQTFRMLNYVAWRDSRRTGWEACMKDCYSYEYQFDMTLDELHTLAKLQKEDPQYFNERTMFFNGSVVVALLSDYLYRLDKYVKKQNRENPRTYRKQPYVKLSKYGNVLIKDIDEKVYGKIKLAIMNVKNAVMTNNYAEIERTFGEFMKYAYNKLPYETTKSSVWKDAFKGSGAFYTLQNLVRWHNVIIRGCKNKYDSEALLNSLLYGSYRNDVWKFHQLLVDTIEYNNFDLKKSIADGNCAPGTKSDKAKRYGAK